MFHTLEKHKLCVLYLDFFSLKKIIQESTLNLTQNVVFH